MCDTTYATDVTYSHGQESSCPFYHMYIYVHRIRTEFSLHGLHNLNRRSTLPNPASTHPTLLPSFQITIADRPAPLSLNHHLNSLTRCRGYPNRVLKDGLADGTSVTGAETDRQSKCCSVDCSHDSISFSLSYCLCGNNDKAFCRMGYGRYHADIRAAFPSSCTR